MAIVWEFNIISEKFILPEALNQIIEEYGDNVHVKAIISIDDWEWSNQQKLGSVSEIREKLENGKIIVAEMQAKEWKTLGMYIEKQEIILYTFWINTEGIQELDMEQITDANNF